MTLKQIHRRVARSKKKSSAHTAHKKFSNVKKVGIRIKKEEEEFEKMRKEHKKYIDSLEGSRSNK